MGRKVGMTDKQYLDSGVWKCSLSPTGAHHWVQMVETEKLRTGGYFRCKYCNDVRTFQLSFSSKEFTVTPYNKQVNLATTL